MRGRIATRLATAALLHAPAAAQSGPILERVRPIDPWAGELLPDGWRSSPTMRALIDTLESSDLIVQVEAQKTRAAFRGRLRFMTAVQDCRYVRVSVKVPGRREDVLAALAHEPQHAVEMAEAPDVRGEQQAEALLRRIGWEWKPTVFETETALTIEERVRLEVMRSR